MQLIQQSHHSDAFKERLMGICLGVTAEIVEENPTFVGVAELEDTVERAILEMARTGQSDPARLVRYASCCGKTLIREAALKLRSTFKPAQPLVRCPLGSYRYGMHKRMASLDGSLGSDSPQPRDISIAPRTPPPLR